MKIFLLSQFLFFMISVQLNSQPATKYVDAELADECIGTYSVSARTCGSGNKIAYNNLLSACRNAVAGDTILIRQGTYSGDNNRINPLNSGTKGKEIVFKNYNNEKVTITSVGNNYPILIEKKEYITIEGLTFDNVYSWGSIIDSNHIILKGNNFLQINSGNWLSLHFVNSNYNKVLNNNFYSPVGGAGKDNLQFVYSNHNLIEGNRIESTGHVLWAIKCGNFNVVRNNYFYNHNQKIGEVFDCNDGTKYTERHKHVNATKFNLIENNIFAYTDKDRLRQGRPSGPFNGIQYAGQDGILRKNVFYNNHGGGLGLTTYFDEAEYNTGNRVYNNTLYKNGFAGINISGSAKYAFSDNIIKNNIIYKNNFTNWDNVYDKLKWTNADGKPIQIWTSRKTSDHLVEYNNIFNSAAKENFLIAQAGDYAISDTADRSLQYWEKHFPMVYRKNIQEDPLFVNEENFDFNLKPGSPMIDKGAFLTKTTGSGRGNQMKVEDVRYFYDGYDIEGEEGDIIQLKNGGTARIISINYSTNTLTLDRKLRWKPEQGISLVYSGKAPDIGAFEFLAGSR